MKIAVCGSTKLDMYPEAVEPSKLLGEELAKRGHTIITGACGGFPEYVVMAAHDKMMQAIGYSASCDRKQHEEDGLSTKGLSEIVFLPEIHRNKPIHMRYKLRNIDAIEACDAVLFVAGRMGSLNEFTLAADFRKPIGVLMGTGGMADVLEDIMKIVPQKPHPGMWFLSDPKAILDQLEKAVA